MTDTQFADISEFQVPVDDSYPWQFIAIRSNDGSYLDAHWQQNYDWCRAAADSGRIGGFIVYFVYWPNWWDGIAALQQHVGDPHPRMAVMIDMENWGGRIAGDQSEGANAAREELIQWLGGDRRRVIGYANAGDFNNLWPDRGDAMVILANYVGNPSWPNKLAHQYANDYDTPPFGPCDINSADGYSVQDLLNALGLPVGDAVAPAQNDVIAGRSARGSSNGRVQIDTATVQPGDNLTRIAQRYAQADITAQSIADDNDISNASLIFPGEMLRILTANP